MKVRRFVRWLVIHGLAMAFLVALLLVCHRLVLPKEVVRPPLWTVRSRHFLYGVPTPVDQRYDFYLGENQSSTCGISVLAREGFWVGHSDYFRVPVWVCYSWTRDYLKVSEAMEASSRNFKEDEELPAYARASPDFSFQETNLDRGHMAPQESNQAWGEDNVRAGCLMSNIVPQKSGLNRGIWKKLETVERTLELPAWSEVDCIWVICGAVFEDLKPQQTLPNKVGVPQATYKIVAWLTADQKLEAHGFIFPQSASGGYLSRYLVPVDEIEKRTGLDFFWELSDKQENQAEAALQQAIWKDV